MIQNLENSDNTERSSIIMPNQAMPLQGLSRVRLLNSAIALAVTTPFYSVGLTPVLPCSGIEPPVNNWRPNHLPVRLP